MAAVTNASDTDLSLRLRAHTRRAAKEELIDAGWLVGFFPQPTIGRPAADTDLYRRTLAHVRRAAKLQELEGWSQLTPEAPVVSVAQMQPAAEEADSTSRSLDINMALAMSQNLAEEQELFITIPTFIDQVQATYVSEDNPD